VELLATSHLSLRTDTSDAITRIGRPAVPSLIEGLSRDDPDLSKAILVTLDRLGPTAVEAAPAVEALLEDGWLGPWASAALRSIQRREGMGSLCDGGSRPIWLLLGAALVVVLLAGLALWLWAREALWAAPRDAITVGVGVSLVTAGAGPILGYRSWSVRRTVVMSCLLGAGGGMGGFLLASLFVMLVGPIAQVLGR
jgi:hypothetical protein